jgi:hypothetical protein
MNDNIFWDVVTMILLSFVVVLLIAFYHDSYNKNYSSCLDNVSISNSFIVNTTCSDSVGHFWVCSTMAQTDLEDYCASQYGEEWHFFWE